MWPVHLVKSGLLVQFVFVTIYVQCCEASSIYIGRYASGTRVEQRLTYKGCKDFNTRKCQMIINWYGKDVCNPSNSSWARSLLKSCPGSCGICECKDQLGRFCLTLSRYCSTKGATGKFLKNKCPKTCNTCDQRVSGGSQPQQMMGLEP